MAHIGSDRGAGDAGSERVSDASSLIGFQEMPSNFGYTKATGADNPPVTTKSETVESKTIGAVQKDVSSAMSEAIGGDGAVMDAFDPAALKKTEEGKEAKNKESKQNQSETTDQNKVLAVLSTLKEDSHEQASRKQVLDAIAAVSNVSANDTGFSISEYIAKQQQQKKNYS